jgi:hypothetical protein
MLLLPIPATGQSTTEVDLTLVLAVDCSYSVDDQEYLLQMQGLARALLAEDVLAAIDGGRHRRIAVTLTQWAGVGDVQVVVPWTLIDGKAAATRLARRLAITPRVVGQGSTSISSAIDSGILEIARSPFRGTRAAIDVSSDGFNNNGPPPETARDRAVRADITVNALAILSDFTYLEDYFENHVVGGPGHFVIAARDYRAFAEAIHRKLLKEIDLPSA